MKWFLITLFLAGCSLSRVYGPNLLEKRADYDGTLETEVFFEGKSPLLRPKRSKPQIADIWIHPHEMPSGDYFMGGWIRTLVSHSKWEMERVKAPSTLKEKRKKVEMSPPKKKRETPYLLKRSREKRKQ